MSTVSIACDHDRHRDCPHPATCLCGCHVFARLGLPHPTG